VPTLLRKSVAADGCPSVIQLLTTGFDLPGPDAGYATPTLRDLPEADIASLYSMTSSAIASKPGGMTKRLSGFEIDH
jgi:hypothetical protein